MASRRWRTAGALGASVVLGGCAGAQSMLDPAGSGARRIAGLWWMMFGVGTAVFLVVSGLAVYALLRQGRVPPEEMAEQDDKAVRWVVAGAGITVAILLVFLVASFSVGRANRGPEGSDALVVEIVGHQWWWEVTYVDTIASRTVRTANEVHLPVGRPVRLDVLSRDVIHSIWAPNLGGKIDLIPGRENQRWLEPETVGVFRGQCSEFCGLQHANMGIVFVVEPEHEFAEWLERQRQPAVAPTDPLALAGAAVFLSAPCSMCHAIRGTAAAATAGPDLTHLASRRTLAAGTLPNTTGHLGAWIADPQGIKPGNHMPAVDLGSEELQALLAYLGTLE